MGAAAVSLLLAGCGGGGDSVTPPPVPTPPAGRPALPQTYRPSGHGAAGDVFVHLFEWRWADVAAECENVLGPAGFAAVQVSPPQEHAVQAGGTWSERYQPVSYSVERSRSGTGAEFREMAGRCRAAGVAIYVDAVINHMTNVPSPGVGSNGTAYSKYSYPGLYGDGDFHPPCTVADYASAANVQDCELFGLPDLNTGSASVRAKIADYLVSLARMGVAGFRIDAAKHVQQVELDSIVARVDRTLAAEGRPLPYWFAEVSAGAGEALGPRDYFGVGYGSGAAADITEFVFRGTGNKFLGVNGEHVSQLNPGGPPGSRFSESAWGLMPADKAVVFLENHDTQRQGGISYRDGAAFRLANVWMLAQPYGYPSVLSGYAFDRSTQAGREMGPPSDAGGWTKPVACAASLETAANGDWVCEHRDPAIRRMVAFRRFVAGTDVNHWWDDGANAIAFSRGDRGFVAINRESARVTATVGTGLPAGTYCDLLAGGRAGGGCAGASVTIDAAGMARLDLAANTAVAVTAAAKI
ncbi:alpha-amylase family protein [Longimicrobium sp.]|uniref:alpha-amylase n=1 Tax=Longimicrobium sp. TaxID=2029185 RepID=UPI002D7FC3BC|nr:alpha-amylase family protein [Longimicrobium sp.]